MKVILTGSNGTLGQEMSQLLKQNSIPFLRVKCRYKDINNISKRLLDMDIHSIIHLGAKKNNISTNYANGYQEDLYNENVVSSILLAKIALTKDVPFVFTSTADLFPRIGLPSDEASTISATKENITGGFYGWSKYLAEIEIKKLPVKYIIFRSSTIYQHLNPQLFTFARYLNDVESLLGFHFSSDQYLLNLIRADYLCKSILNILFSTNHNQVIYNYTSSEWISPYQIISAIYANYGLPVPSEFISKKIVRKRFNASNSSIRNLLSSDYNESNYLYDLIKAIEKPNHGKLT